MAKGPYITDKTRQLIASEYIKDPNAVAKEIQNAVNKRLEGKGPGLSTVQKELAKIRKRDEERSPESKELDRPWSIGTLVEYDITPEALPNIVEIQNLRRNAEKPLTIREAKWVGRLYTLNADIGELSLLSLYYAWRERISEISNVPIDTFKIDDIILAYPGAGAGLLLPEIYSDSRKKDLADSVFETENLFELNLQRPDFTVSELIGYGALLMSMLESGEYEKKTKEELKQSVLSMRECAKKISKEVTASTSDIDLKNKITKGDTNERSHNKEG